MQGRLIKMLRLLINDDADSISDLADRLNVTQKTVRNYVKKINEVLDVNEFAGFNVDRSEIKNNLSAEQMERIRDTVILDTEDQLYLTFSQRIVKF